MEIAELIQDWREFYRRELEIQMPDTPFIPKPQDGFERLIIVAPQLTHRKVIRALEERFGVFCHYKVHGVDPDRIVVERDRMPDAAYGVWIRANVDADEEFANLSANDLRASKVAGITLLERLLLELKRFVDTGRHCDVDSQTLCTGSRHCDGSSPCVCWESPLGRLDINWVFPHIKGKSLRCRAVVA